MNSMALNHAYVAISDRRVRRVPPMYQRVLDYMAEHPQEIVVLMQGVGGFGVEYHALGESAEWMKQHVPGAVIKDDRNLNMVKHARSSLSMVKVMVHAHKLGKTFVRLDIFGKIATYPPRFEDVAPAPDESQQEIVELPEATQWMLRAFVGVISDLRVFSACGVSIAYPMAYPEEMVALMRYALWMREVNVPRVPLLPARVDDRREVMARRLDVHVHGEGVIYLGAPEKVTPENWRDRLASNKYVLIPERVGEAVRVPGLAWEAQLTGRCRDFEGARYWEIAYVIGQRQVIWRTEKDYCSVGDDVPCEVVRGEYIPGVSQEKRHVDPFETDAICAKVRGVTDDGRLQGFKFVEGGGLRVLLHRVVYRDGDRLMYVWRSAEFVEVV